MSSSTTDDNTGQSLTAALSLPTDLSITIHHHSASPDLGRRHGQQRRRSKARQGATTRGRELVQGAPLIPDRVKGTSGMVLYAFIYAYQTNCSRTHFNYVIIPSASNVLNLAVCGHRGRKQFHFLKKKLCLF
jgi:hypothetical protein